MENKIPKATQKIKTKDIEGFNFKIIDSKGYTFDKNYVYHGGKRKKKSTDS